MNTDSPDANFSLYAGSKNLQETSASLRLYTKDIVRKITREYVRSNSSEKPIDFGSGIAFLAKLFRDEVGIDPILVEIDPYLRAKCLKEKFQAFANLDELNVTIDFVYSSNVLEHIENDVLTLEHLWRKIERHGVLVLYLPAHQCLFSKMDKEIGHFRRYSKKDLRRKLQRSGFTVARLEYHDSLGFFVAFFMKVLGYRSGTSSGRQSELYFYDKIIFPLSWLLDRMGARFLVGKNLFCVAIKR